MSAPTTPAPRTTPFGEMPDGGAVTAYEIGVEGGPRVRLLDLGATVQSLRLPAPDGEVAVCLGYASVEEYLSKHNGYLGATVGRFANRIAGGRFELDGRTYELAANEPPNLLHGGPDGLSHRVWSVVSHSVDDVTFEIASPDGDQGFPGELRVRATYRVTGDSVRIELSAETDAATPVSLTNHTYFNLGGAGSVEEHVLTLDADDYLPIEVDGVPTGEVLPVAGTPFDFTAPAQVGPRVGVDDEQIRRGSGLDHPYVLRGAGLRRAARLEHPASGRYFEVLTDQDSLQVYSGNHFDGTLTDATGSPQVRFAGIALEPQRYPDAPNRPEFPSAVLQPGERYTCTIVWSFGAVPPAE